MTKSKTFILGFALLFIMLSSFAFTESTATLVPIINAKIDTNKFYPATINSSAVLSDYYIIPTGESLPSQITYHTNNNSITSTSASYTVGSSSDVYGTSGSTTLNDGSTLSSSLTTNTTRSTTGFNPFLPTTDPLPRAVKLNNQNGQLNNQNGQYLQNTQVEPFSLHMDYSLTFFADTGYTYIGVINTTKTFFLDIAIETSGATVTLSFGTGPYGPIIVPISVPKMTIPIYPVNGTELQFVTITTNQNTVITLAPHSITSNTLKIESVPVNNSYIEEFTQGTQSTPGGNAIFSVREFNLSVISGQYYQIYFNYQDYNTCPTCSTYLTAQYQFLLGNNYLPISGSLTGNNGVTIFATVNTNITVVFVAQGYQDGSYTLIFRNIQNPQGNSLRPLQFGTNIILNATYYYTFTLSQPAVIALNFSSTADNTRIHNMNWYVTAAENGPLVSVATTNTVYQFSYGGAPTAGNLYGATVGGMRTSWAYFPAGSYAVSVSSTMASKIEFTMAYVQTLASSASLNMNQNSLYAIELSNMAFNQINLLNFSTTDHINQTIQYQYVILGKYYDKIPTSEGYTATTLGNKQQNNQWIAFNTNNTNLGTYIPTTSDYVPIMIIHPFQAQFLNLSIEHTFTGTLTVSTNTPVTFYGTSVTFTFPTASNDRFISETASVTTSGSFVVNNDKTTYNYQLFAIPLTTDPNSLYNVTVYLIGNYSSTAGHLNASFVNSPNSVYVYGSNLRDLNINFGSGPGPRAAGSNIVESWINQWILTASSASYLYAYVLRTPISTGVYRNATLMVTLQKLPVTTLNFGPTAITSFSWNQTVSAQELKATAPILTFTSPSNFGSFNGGGIDVGQLLLLGGGIAVAAVVIGGIYVKRDKVKGVIQNIKKPSR